MHNSMVCLLIVCARLHVLVYEGPTIVYQRPVIARAIGWGAMRCQSKVAAKNMLARVVYTERVGRATILDSFRDASGKLILRLQSLVASPHL
ncbi:hypothetical protein CC86DRAFT_154934 [Ophiobolus disseminans]|uniref:Secreted protein n=1 Tax=Ophiobolus disseminans TaxID=1469910 RepID=A0A6A6ZEM5_9PLEO|nr:hypothetical protein CC86DRAFT_154934 [Ophiobolus disseminans]